MSGELSKTYDPAAVEAEAYRVWLEEKCFAADPAKPGEPYTIVIPPPNVTGALHLGHAINNTLQDILTRVHRMRGCNTLWVPGIDHAGIATQAVVEKQLKEKENKTRHDIGREELVRRIWEWKEQYGLRILEQLKRLGCSCDWDRTRFTLDEICARAVRETFFKLFKDGLIYRGKRLVNWDIHLQTSISDDEIYHETVKTSLWHVRYPIDGTDKFVTVATTRPETMLGDTAVAVHSQDARWNWAIGKMVRLPLTDRLIPIIADDILVDPKFGSGVVKVTPGHDYNDNSVWQRHLGKADEIGIIDLLNPDGTVNDLGGKYANMKREAARKKVVEDLAAQGLLEKEEPYETQIGHSDRSKTPIEPIRSDQWFVKMAPLAEPALEVVRNGTIKFFPERHAQQYLAWLGEKRDWPISRQLWWGHRIPVWTKRISNATTGQYPYPNLLRAVREELAGKGLLEKEIGDSMTSSIDEHDIACQLRDIGDAGTDFLVCIRPGAKLDLLEKAIGHSGFHQDPDVLDTWFSSALWPHSTLGWPDQTPELKKYYPTSVLLTGRDIITLWVARMVMTGLYNMGEVPFHRVAINPTILDGKGERMSKSKGNGVDPVDIIDTHGADALRFTMTLMATETQDARLPVKKDAQGRNTSEKFDIGRNFANKLWNAARFAMANLQTQQAVLGSTTLAAGSPRLDDARHGQSLVERWIVSRFNQAVKEAEAALAINQAVKEADAALANYRFDHYAKICYDFFWRDFCDWYVEAMKPTLKNSSGQAVLAAVLDGALRLMHPMIPFITETIWWKLNEVRPERGIPGLQCPPSKRLIHAEWPKAGEIDAQADAEFANVQGVVTAIRNFRNNYKIPPGVLLPGTVHIYDPSFGPGGTGAKVAGEKTTIELLGQCNLDTDFDKFSSENMQRMQNSPQVSAGNCQLWFDLRDAGIETERSQKRREELIRQRDTLKARLDNPSYIAKAPPHLVEQTKAQLAEAEAELAKMK